MNAVGVLERPIHVIARLSGFASQAPSVLDSGRGPAQPVGSGRAFASFDFERCYPALLWDMRGSKAAFSRV